jgi:cyclohexanone monooxygenase
MPPGTGCRAPPAVTRPRASASFSSTPGPPFTEQGVVTADGTLHELDVLILATGFDAVDGNYRRIDIR